MTRWISCLAVALFAFAKPAIAQTDSHLILDDWDSGYHIEASADALLFGRSRLQGGGTTSFSEWLSQGRVRLDPTMPLSPSVGYDWTHFGLSDNPVLPRRLDDLSFAAGSPLFSQENWFGGATVGFGYAGDEAFGRSNAYYGKASFFVGDDLGDGQTLLFMVAYDGNRTFFPDLPLPSVEYDNKFDRTLEFVLGLPQTAIIWNPSDQWLLTLSYDFPNTLFAEVDYNITSNVVIQARYASDENAFHVSGLPDDRRLFYNGDRVEAGIEWAIDDHLKLSATAGYAFSRQFSQGFDDRDLSNQIAIEDQFYLGLSAELDW
jgi:hypothetical protein